ncbi:unnamed protein product [Withania somnifera]
MEKVELRWEQREVEVEEEVEGLLVGSSKAIKEVTDGKIETNGHADSTSKITNGTEKSDLGDEPERSEEEELSDSSNGVEVDEGTEPKEVPVQKTLVSNNGVEVGTEKSDLDGELERLVEYLSGSNNGVEVEEETEPKEELVQQIIDSSNGVEEATELIEESVHQIVASNEVEKGTEVKEESKHHHVTYTDGVEEGTDPKEESIQQIVASNNGVEVEDGTEPEKESALQIVASVNGVEEGTEPKEVSVQQLAASNNGVEEGTEAKEESNQHLLTSTDGVEVELGTEAEEGPFRSGHFVYYDKDEGIWKCRTCSWTLQGKSLGIGWTKIPRSHLDKLMNYPTLDQRGLLFSFGSKGNGFKLFQFFGEKGNKENVKVEQTPTTNKNWFSSIFASDKGKASVEQGSGIGENAVKNDSGVPMPSDNFKDQSAKALVIKESASHAYSSSEITQEAGGKILGSNNQDANMKGKMVINTVGKSENAIKSQEGGSVFDIFDVGTYNQPGTSTSSKEVQGNDRNDELLRATGRIQVSYGDLVQGSLPTSNDMKDELFRTGGRIQVSNGNLVQVSLSTSNDRKDELFRTDGRIQVSNGNLVQESLSTSNDRKDELFRTDGRIQVSNGDLVQESLPASNDRKDKLLRNGGEIQVSNGKLGEDSVPASQQNELTLLITSTKEESLTIEKSETDLKSGVAILDKDPGFTLNSFDGNGKPKFLTDIPQEHEQHIETKLPSESLLENNDNKFQLSSKDGAHHYEVSQHTITTTNIEIHSNQPLKVDQGALMSSVKDALSIQDKPDNITNISVEAAANSIAGSDTIITVEAGNETTSANLGQGTDAAEAYKIEIVRSIVFGGLAESVTSLSVVASATGGDTSTLNILVLAMANLIGGLFIIFHNIWDLKRDRFEQASNETMEKYVDRYQEQLGRRENFTVHAVFVVLSYIIFGLVPPVIYGFSFRKSDDKELKIVAVAAASLVCILMLATGKAYAQKAPKPYFKTISAYIILGFTVSGVSYAAGILFKRLLEKLGLFQPNSPANLFLPEMPGTGAAWASL